MGKEESLQQVEPGQLDTYLQENKVGSLPHITPKINLKWIKDLNVRDKPINPLGKNIGSNLCDLKLNNGFSDMRPKAGATKQEIDQTASEPGILCFQGHY